MNRKQRNDEYMADITRALESRKDAPARCKTNQCDLDGSCLRYLAYSGEACRSPEQP